MSYSLWSHGRLLGTTDLAHARCAPRERSGDLNPADCPDLLAAADRREPLDLELRGPDGEIVATSSVVVQDTERLLARAAESEREHWDDEEIDVDAGLGGPVEFDPTRSYDEGAHATPETDLYAEPEALEPRELPRWQVLVTLADAGFR